MGCELTFGQSDLTVCMFAWEVQVQSFNALFNPQGPYFVVPVKWCITCRAGVPVAEVKASFTEEVTVLALYNVALPGNTQANIAVVDVLNLSLQSGLCFLHRLVDCSL